MTGCLSTPNTHQSPATCSRLTVSPLAGPCGYCPHLSLLQFFELIIGWHSPGEDTRLGLFSGTGPPIPCACLPPRKALQRDEKGGPGRAHGSAPGWLQLSEPGLPVPREGFPWDPVPHLKCSSPSQAVVKLVLCPGLDSSLSSANRCWSGAWATCRAAFPVSMTQVMATGCIEHSVSCQGPS